MELLKSRLAKKHPNILYERQTTGGLPGTRLAANDWSGCNEMSSGKARRRCAGKVSQQPKQRRELIYHTKMLSTLTNMIYIYMCVCVYE